MERRVLLLRGINVGGKRRVPMAQLRALLTDAGFQHVATYVQSGNIVLGAEAAGAELEDAVSALIGERFGFDVPVIARTAGQLAAVVALDPLAEVVTDPRLYQVTFLATEPDPEVLARLGERASETERIVAHGRELYSWHPDGIARSRMAMGLTAQALGASATARNWRTVTILREMASAPLA